MNIYLRVVLFIIGLVFTRLTIKYLISKKITERNSILWLLACLLIFIFSLAPVLLDKIAKLIGVDYPPTLLFLFSTLILLWLVFIHTIQISMLKRQITELTQWIVVSNDGDKK
jgi:hypothetical protein